MNINTYDSDPNTEAMQRYHPTKTSPYTKLEIDIIEN